MATNFQKLFCCICGKEFLSTVHNNYCQGRGAFKEAVCSWECHKEKDWRYALSVMDRAYYPPKKTNDEE